MKIRAAVCSISTTGLPVALVSVFIVPFAVAAGGCATPAAAGALTAGLSAAGTVATVAAGRTADGRGRSADSPVGEPASAAAPPAVTPASQSQEIGPRLIMPATGGTPVMGIPLGGKLYQPVAGGTPVFGTPLTP